LYYPKAKEKNSSEIIPSRLINGKMNYFTGELLEDKKSYREQSIENIAYEILSGIKNGKKYSDYAILVRNSTKMSSFKEVFAKYNIPLFFKEKVGFTESNAFNILYNILRFLDNTNRDASLLAILHTEVFDYSNDELLKLSITKGKNLFEKLQNSEKKKDYNTVNLLKKWLNFSLNNSLPSLLECIATDIDFKNYLVTIDVNDEELDYYENFIDIVNDYQNIDNKLSGLVNQLKTIKNDEVFETKKRTPNDSVTLSTIHISKGLEYKVVFIMGLEENLFPSIRDAESSADEKNKMEEERRLAYVAITRAKEKLFMSYANRRMQFGSIKMNKRSRFLDEVPNKLMHFESAFGGSFESTESSLEQANKFISNLSPKIKIADKPKTSVSTNYDVNDIVVHKKFGEGTVLDITDDNVKVEFSEVGTKTLLIEYANLTRKE